MFTRMVQVKREMHKTRDTNYEVLVYRIQETGEHRIYVAKGGFGVGDLFTASQEVVSDAKVTNGQNVVDELIAAAKDDISRNEFGLY
jgi:hypothetical protein